MDYITIVKRAWQITRKYPMLWVLGFFAGGTFAASGGQGGGWSDNGSSGGYNYSDGMEAAVDWASGHVGLIVAAGVFLFAVALVMWVVGVAARGGLVSEVGIADEGLIPSLGRGWRTGFKRFWRVFAIQFVTALPVIAAGIVFAVLVVLMLVPVFRVVGFDSATDVDFGGFIVLGLLFIIGIPLIIVLSLLANAWSRLALAAGVLDDKSLGSALEAGWLLVRRRLGSVAVVALIEIAASILVGIVIASVAAIFVIPAIFGGVLGAATGAVVFLLPVFAIVGLLVFMVVAVVMSAANTFTTALWTIAYREMSSMGPSAGVVFDATDEVPATEG